MHLMTQLQPLQPTGTPISAAELRDRLGDPDLTIVDLRPTAAFNGWRLRGEARGGHIPGAVAFPSAWLASEDDAEVHIGRPIVRVSRAGLLRGRLFRSELEFVEGRHLVQDAGGGLYEGNREARAGSFAEAKLEIE